MRRVVVIGAGISGLAAAYRLIHPGRSNAAPPPLEVIVLDRAAEVGGKAQTICDRGWQVETGPAAYLDDSEILRALIKDVGLEGERIEANRDAQHRYLVRRGTPQRVPTHPIRFLASGFLNPLGILRAAREPWIPPASADQAEQESVYQFVARRLGTQAADRLVSPMVLGVYAGDAKELSLPAAFPKLAALERDHGSLIRGALAKRREIRQRSDQGAAPGIEPTARLCSFRAGMQTLPQALARTAGIEVRTNSVVLGIEPSGAQWRIAVAGESTLSADAVILAGEPASSAAIVQDSLAPLAAEFSGITVPAVSVVALGFDAEAAKRFPHGFGALVPRDQGYRLLGTLWDGRIFPDRGPRGELLVRSIYGGAADPTVETLDDEALTELAREEIARLIGLDTPPTYQRTIRWPEAIPQYEIGHLDRVSRVETILREFPSLAIAGNALYGVAYGKAAEAGVRAAHRIGEYFSGANDHASPSGHSPGRPSSSTASE